jgi:hypothetical protein
MEQELNGRRLLSDTWITGHAIEMSLSFNLMSIDEPVNDHEIILYS